MITTSSGAGRRFIKGASILTASQLVVAACSFFRNIIIARHISVEDYGIATTFALTLSLIEMTSNLALDRILVQDKDGESDAMLGSSHALQFARGLITGAILFMLATPVAYFFDLPHLAWAYQLVALIPVINGLIHWDMVVKQRHLDFFPSAMSDALPQLFTLTMAYFASVYFSDYRAMLAVILSQSLLVTVLSHFFADRPYRWVIQRDLIRKNLNFGWPLLVNGLLMFAIFHGDRAVIGAYFSMETLGWYSTAFSLAMLPTLIFAKISSFLLMPILSKSRFHPERYELHCTLAVALCFCFGIFMVVFFAIAGKAIIALSFGQRYALGGTVILWLGIMQALRIVRIAPTVISNSQARTKNAMYANIFRSTALALAVVIALFGFSVEWIAISGIIGESIALCVSFYLLVLPEFKRRLVKRSLAMAAYFTLVTVVAALLSREVSFSANVWQNIGFLAMGILVAVLSATVFCISDKKLRLELTRMGASLFNRGSAAS